MAKWKLGDPLPESCEECPNKPTHIHKYRRLEKIDKTFDATDDSKRVTWTRTDRLVCETCGEIKEIKKSTISKQKPEWY